MEARIRAIAKKVERSGSEVEIVVSKVAAAIHTKRQYEDLFESVDSVDKMSKKLGFSETQAEILREMQSEKSIYRPNVWLDHILTAIFLFECALVVIVLRHRSLLGSFSLGLVATHIGLMGVKYCGEAVGKYLGALVHRLGLVDSNPMAGKVQLKKWTEQSWQLFVHVVAACLELKILLEQPWFDDPRTCWLPRPEFQETQTDLLAVYLGQLAIWIYTCIIHRFVDERRKDYFVLYLHHLVTIALVAASWWANYVRIGLLVLWVHDASDIFVDLLKMVNYLKLESFRGYFASEIAYASCMVAWVYFRLYRFPFKVIWGSVMAPIELHGRYPRLSLDWHGFFPEDMPLHTEMNMLLVVLLCMHIYWFHLLSMVGYRMITESAREASRQEYEGDSDGE